MHLPQRETDRRSAGAITLDKVPALDLEAALRHWSDPVAVARLDVLRGPLATSWWDDDLDGEHYRERFRLRHTLVRRFLDRMTNGELVLTGLAAPISLASRREVIPADIIEVLEISFVDATARAPGLRLIQLKVHEAQGQKGASRSAWDGSGAGHSPAPDEFQHNGDYSRVVIRCHVFDLSGGLCQIVARLHEAALSTAPWLVGKQIMAECGYGFALIGDAFKRHQSPSWRELIEGNNRGLYRLNLHTP